MPENDGWIQVRGKKKTPKLVKNNLVQQWKPDENKYQVLQLENSMDMGESSTAEGIQPCHNNENHALPLTGTHEGSTNSDMWAIIPVVATENGAQTSFVQKDLGDNSRVLNIPKEGTFNFLVEKNLSKDVGEKHRCHKFCSINYNALMTAK